MLLTFAGFLTSALILIGWLRRRTDPPRPWLLVAAVPAAVTFSFYWDDPFTRVWFQFWPGLLDRQGFNEDDHPLLYAFVNAFLAASLYEEVFKLGVLGLVCLVPRMLGTAREGAVWGALVGTGHALGENFKYHLGQEIETALWAGGSRLLLTTSLGVTLGYSLGTTRATGSWRSLAAGFLAVIALHGVYDLGAMIAQGPALPYLEREEMPPWPQALCILAAFAALVFTDILGLVFAVKAFGRKPPPPQSNAV